MSDDGLVNSEEEDETTTLRKSSQAEADFECGDWRKPNKVIWRKHLNSPGKFDDEQRSSSRKSKKVGKEHGNLAEQSLNLGGRTPGGSAMD